MTEDVNAIRERLEKMVSDLREMTSLEIFQKNVPGEFEHRTRLRYELNYAANSLERACIVLGVVGEKKE